MKFCFKMADDTPPVRRKKYRCCARDENDDRPFKKRCWRCFVKCISPVSDEPGESGEGRETWSNRATFVLSALGMAVGLGQVWRFPTLTYKHGGGAFLIIYSVMILTLGLVVCFFEIANGQYSSKHPIFVYDKVPLFQGVGMSMVAYSYFISTYYNHMVSFALYYLFSSFKSPLPWTYCPEPDHPDSMVCVPFKEVDSEIEEIVCNSLKFTFNHTKLCSDENYAKEEKEKCCKNLPDQNKCGDAFDVDKICSDREYPSAYFWSHSVTKQYRKDDANYGYLGPVNGYLVGTSALAWLLNYISLYKGLKSLGVLMYIAVPLPYVILVIMLVVALLQDGASNGLVHMFTPNPWSFIDINVWRVATEQAFYSFGAAMGPFITFGSYANFKNPSHIDATIISVVLVLTSVLCGMVVFSVLGFLSKKTGKPFDKVVESGPGLVFIVYPESLRLLPGSAFFSIIFYLMLINLGTSSVTGIIETVSSGAYDIWPKTRRYKYIVNFVVLLTCYLIGMSITARGGMEVYEAFDTYGGGMTLIPICALELFAVVYIYGLGRFCEDLAFMIGFYPNRYFRYLWIIGPWVLLAIFVYGMVLFKAPEKKIWSPILGWFVFLGIMGPIPVTAIYRLIQYGWQKRIKEVHKPVESHGPRGSVTRGERINFTVRRRIF